MTPVNLLIPETFGRGEATPRPDAFVDQRAAGETMGTTWSARWFAAPGVQPAGISEALERGFSEMIASMSKGQPDSLISRYNSLAPGEHMEIDAPFSEVMALALEVARRSSGAFDPCLGADVSRAGFGAMVGASVPQLSVTGPAAWTQVLATPLVLFQPGGLILDLSAIAKGYAVDRMADVLEGAGLSQFLVEIGGEFVARGVRADAMPWWVDIENPYPDSTSWRVALVGRALATSGDYRQRREVAGQTLSHIFPAASRSCTGGDLASVSVLHAQCALADAWATALFAAGDLDGLAMAASEGIAALFQYRDAPARLSPAMRRLSG